MWPYIGGLILVGIVVALLIYAFRTQGTGQSDKEAEDHNGD